MVELIKYFVILACDPGQSSLQHFNSTPTSFKGSPQYEHILGALFCSDSVITSTIYGITSPDRTIATSEPTPSLLSTTYL